MSQAKIVAGAAEKLKADKAGKNLTIGFDGFVDEIIRVVKTRKSPKIGDCDYYETIGDFAKKIADAAGYSANIEFEPQQIKLGGNGPILANALILQGHKTSYIGALGEKTIDPVFADFAKSCEASGGKVITMAIPGHADALEFDDGKIICGKTASLPAVNWENLLTLVSREELKKLVAESDFLGFTNWMELPNFNTLLVGFNEILAETKHRPTIFIDLADPARRPTEEVKEVCNFIMQLEENANVILGLNESESRQIAEAVGVENHDSLENTMHLICGLTDMISGVIRDSGGCGGEEKIDGRLDKNSISDKFVSRAKNIIEKMKITAIVIHPLKGAAVATKDDSSWIDGPYCQKPKLTTGAGDNFNAGFCNGWLAGLTPVECLCSGVCTSGFYVRECRSPNRAELVKFMEKWSAEGAPEIW